MRLNVDGLEVFFPYDYIYKEQFNYMLELKRALDAKGDALLEMPTGTGKTVTILALITSYQLAHPETGKLIYCTRTVPEMTKTMRELKRVINYRKSELAHDAAARGEAIGTRGDILGVCLSARRNMCIHERVAAEADRENVDSACRSLTASWVRAKAHANPGSAPLCEYFEGWDTSASDADIAGIYTLDDIKELGKTRGWCPYYMTRHILNYANVVVFNYQYMLDPKISNLISRELEDKSIVVFDEAHNIDNVAIEALSVTLDQRALEASTRNLNQLSSEVKRLKEADSRRLQEEYSRLISGLTAGGALGEAHASAAAATAARAGGPAAAGSSAAAGTALVSAQAAGAATTAGVRGGEDPLPSAVLPADLLEEAIPGNIRNAELFLRFMKHVVRYLKQRIKVAAVETETPAAFLHAMSTALSIDTRPLRFADSRLSSLMRTLEVTEMEDFLPLHLVTAFVTLLTTYPVGFMLVLEPYNSMTPHLPDPVLQLACLDASLVVKPVLEKYQSVVLTSGTLSPLDMYAKMLHFTPVVRASFEMSIARPCMCPMVVSKGSDQTVLSSQFEYRGDDNVLKNYGALLIELCRVTPDGVVAFFPSYSYMETAIWKWEALGILSALREHKLLFIETKDIVETTLSLNHYKRSCDAGRGGLFLSVARGKVAEGIDFDKHYGRAVVIIGIPYQYTLSHVLRARLVYLRETYNIRESDFLTFDALRQTSQCVGRVIRSKADYGVMVFADMRYGRADKRSKLPAWVQQFLPDAHVGLSADMAACVAQSFLKDMAQPLGIEASIGTSLLTKADVDDIAAKMAAARVSSAGQGTGYLQGQQPGAAIVHDSRDLPAGSDPTKRPRLDGGEAAGAGETVRTPPLRAAAAAADPLATVPVTDILVPGAGMTLPSAPVPVSAASLVQGEGLKRYAHRFDDADVLAGFMDFGTD